MRVIKGISKFIFTTLAIAMSTLSASAALPTDAAPFQVTIPNMEQGLELWVTGLLLKPSNSNLDYGASYNFSGTDAPFNIKTITPGYGGAFGLGVGYVFPRSANDVRINWTHLDTTANDSIEFPPLRLEIIGPIYLTLLETQSAYASSEFKYDVFDFEVGQFINFGTRLNVRLLGGLRYAAIQRNYYAKYDTLFGIFFLPDRITLTEENNAKFNGIGPLFGIDTTYHISHCFGIVGHAKTALLVGTENLNASFTTFISDGTDSLTSEDNFKLDSQTRIVPALEGKLGFNYSYVFGDKQNKEFTAELGYQITEYVDVVDEFYLDLSGIKIFTSDVAFSGPYLTLNLKV